MKKVSIILALCFSVPASVFSQTESTATIDITATIGAPVAACELTAGSNLLFGTLEKPRTGSENASASATTAAITYPLAQTGTTSIGSLSLNVANATSVTITRGDFPATLDQTGGDGELTFSNGAWAASTTSTGTYTILGSSSETPDIPTTGNDAYTLTRYYQIGGDLTVAETSAEGAYTSSMTLTVTCQ